MSAAEAEAEILLADDDDVGRYVLATMLRRAGFAVREVVNGIEAIESIVERPPDLAVLDVRMPGLDGFEVCRRMKAEDRTRHVPVLMLSATFLETEAQVEGLETGADAYLTQPVEAPVLAATVRALLRARRAETAIHAAARQWRTTFDAIRDAVAVVELPGTILRVNRAFAELMGLDPDATAMPTIPELFGGAGVAALGDTDVIRDDRIFAARVDAVADAETDGERGQVVLTLADVTVERGVQTARAEALVRERMISQTLQNSLLPERPGAHPEVRTIAWHRAAERDLIIGGDWYDVIETDHGVWLVIGDVAGHGVAAAAQASQLRHSLRVYAHEGYELTEAVRRVNELVMATDLGGLATLCIAALDPTATRLDVIRAGHPPALFIPAGGAPEFLEETAGPVLGVTGGPHGVVRMAFEPGDRLILYTDGLIERPTESLDVGLARMHAAATGLVTLEDLRAGLIEQLVDLGQLRDDVALLLAERT